MRQTLSPALIAALALLIALGGAGAQEPTALDGPALEHKLQSLLEEVVAADSSAPGASAHVLLPARGLSWNGAAGRVALGSKEALTPRHPLRLASNTKPYVAAAVLRLWEDGALALDATLDLHLPPAYLQLLIDDGYEPSAITLGHLLSHTSGLFDYAASDAYLEQVLANPQRRWSRLDQVRGAVDWGAPLAAPGTNYHYADTGYILLGLIVEQQTGKNLGAALRHLLDYRRLGLDHTWLESLEVAPPELPERAHQYYDAIDTHAFHPSLDLYGGGGLVATMEDLALFMRALGTGAVFHHAATLDTMLARNAPEGSWLDRLSGSYRLGLAVVELGGHRAYVHEGFWGTAAAYFPDLDAAIAVGINQGATGARWSLVERMVEVLVQSDAQP